MVAAPRLVPAKILIASCLIRPISISRSAGSYRDRDPIYAREPRRRRSCFTAMASPSFVDPHLRTVLRRVGTNPSGSTASSMRSAVRRARSALRFVFPHCLRSACGASPPPTIESRINESRFFFRGLVTRRAIGGHASTLHLLPRRSSSGGAASRHVLPAQSDQWTAFPVTIVILLS